MKYTSILVAKDNAVLTITMNRPEKMNACNLEMFSEIDQALSDAEHDKGTKVIIITGAGEKAFSAGVDIEALSLKDLQAASHWVEIDARTFRHIENVPMPVIAAVNGDAFGFGCKIPIVSDFAIASNKARFGLQGIRVGAVHMIMLGRAMSVLGRQRLGYLLLSGEIIDAHKAEHFGIVSKVVSPEELHSEVYGLANRIAEYSPLAIQTIKKLLHRGSDDDYRYEDVLTPHLLAMEDLKEGARAFSEKRKPVFKGR